MYLQGGIHALEVSILTNSSVSIMSVESEMKPVVPSRVSEVLQMCI